MRISWRTVGRCIAGVVDDIEPDHTCRLHELVNIGIDETSYSKGRRYITTVVNHDTNTAVWVAQGHGRAIIDGFFSSLTEEERANIKVVSGDGARWITDAVEHWCPNALRCTDPFHVASWSTEALDQIRREQWQQANKEVKALKKEVNPKKADRLQEMRSVRNMKKLVKPQRISGMRGMRSLTSSDSPCGTYPAQPPSD